MRRFVAILILCLLPLQWSHAAMGEYFSHEYAQAADHDGHHEHQLTDHRDDHTPDEKNAGSHQDCHQHQTAAAIHELPPTVMPRVCATPIVFISHSIPSRSPDNPFRPPLPTRL